jgi:O-antigen ligase/Flp pilus assembly protein TadD
MAMPERHVPAAAVGLLALVVVLLPWTAGGRTPVGQVVLVVALCAAGAIALWRDPAGLSRRAAPLGLLFALPIALSAWQSLYPDKSLQTILALAAYVTGGCLAAGITRAFPWGAGFLLCLAALSGALVAGIGTVRWWQAVDGGLYAGVFTGPFGYPNAAAGFLLLTGGLALAAAVSLQHPTGRWAAAVGSVGILACLPLTRSRGAAVAAALGLAVGAILALRGHRAPRRILPWLLGSGLAAAALGVGTPLGPWLAARFDPTDPSFVWRREMLDMAWNMIRDRPWLGFGPGTFPVAANLYQRVPYVGGQNPHNVYLEWAAELGLPAMLLICAGLATILIRAIRVRPPLPAAYRHRLAALAGTLIAFAAHCALDIDWSYPAIAILAAITTGVVAATPAPVRRSPRPRHPGPRLLLIGLLLGAGLLAGGRFGAGLLVTRAAQRAQDGDLPGAQADLTWALRFNPMSFPAHQLLARTALQRGDPAFALRAAEALADLNPDDPNSLALAGEVAGAAGRWPEAEARFRQATELAPAAQLRLHVGLVEAAVRAGHSAEARLASERLLTLFPPARVLAEDARCLAPGDRYLLARAARWLRPLARDPVSSASPGGLQEAADRLAQPDWRPICGSGGRPGQTSPEAAVQTFWDALRAGEAAAADRVLDASAPPPPRWVNGPAPLARTRMTAVRQLDAGESQALLQYTLEAELPDGRRVEWCAATHLRHGLSGWFIDEPTVLHPTCLR